MKNIFLTLTIFASMLLPAMNAEAQIRTQIEDDVMWIVVDGTDNDDSVYVLETLGGTVIYLYRDGALVDSRYFSSNDSNLDNKPVSIFGGTEMLQTIVVARLNGGDDYYYNNSPHIGADLVSCGTGNDYVDAGPGESWVISNKRDTGYKTIYGGGGDDWLMGGAGDDLILGGNGDDIIIGNDGSDALHGDPGDDDIDGGAGDNYMDGGLGKDTFTSSSQSDYIHDPDQGTE